MRIRMRAKCRQEAVLSQIAKLEMAMRSKRSNALEMCDRARQRGEHGNRAYWSGLAEGYRQTADQISELYFRSADVFGTL